MSSRHLLHLSSPATAFHEGFPIGNGTLGAMAHGRPAVERFDLNIDTLWSGGPAPADEGPPPARLLPDLRDALRHGDFARADDIARQMQSPGWTQSYQPLGRLEWRYAADGEADGYRRELDLARAITRTTYRIGGVVAEIESFVSAPAGVLVVCARGAATDRMTQPALFGSPHPGVRLTEDGHLLIATGRAPRNVLPNYVDQEPAVVYADDEPGADGTVPAGMGFAVVVAVQRTGPGEVRLIAAASTGFRGYDRKPGADLAEIAEQARRRVVAALGVSTEELSRQHVAEYRSLFDRVDLDLAASPGADRAELYYHYGRYLLISSSRPGTQAANLQGIWNADVRPGWSSNYTTNINVQMNYWPAESTGLGDLHEPLFTLTRELTAAGTATAGRYYGAAGAVTHHNTDIWRFTAPVSGDPQWANWPSGLLWLSAHVGDHLDYGAGEDFTRDTARPVLRSVAAFALDMLVDDGQGALIFSPSTSPEHRFRTATGDAATSEGSAMDQELVREVLTRYLHLAVHPDDTALAGRARAALARLRPVAAGADGALLEWHDERPPLEPGHRHVSHLYGLYPGTRITEAGTPHDFEAARRALRHRLDNGSGYTGWSQAWILCLAARLRDPELAERSIAVLLGPLSSVSLLDLHPHDDWPSGYIFQIDGNFGAVAGMTELLVQSHEQAISLLKTLPPSWPGGTVRGIRCRGGHRVDLTWADGALTGATVVTGRGGGVVLEVPGTIAALTVTGPDGRRIPVTAEPGAVAGRHRFAWAGEACTRYEVSPAR